MNKIENGTKIYQYQKVPAEEKLPLKANSSGRETPIQYGYGIRHVQAFLLFISLTVSFIARTHIGLSIVAMTNTPVANSTEVANSTDIANSTINNTESIITYSSDDVNVTSYNADHMDSVFQTYDWPKSTQELVISSFVLGYFIMMLPAGYICQKWGGKLPLQICLLMNGLLCIPQPWFAVWGGWKAVCICRVLQGMAQSGLLPGIHTILAKWVPDSELGRLSTMVYIGCTVGTIAAFQMGGLLIASNWGWPSILWVTGALCLIAYALLTYFGVECPVEHKTISSVEKSFILGRIDDGYKVKCKTPWKAMLSTKAVWAAWVAHAGSGVVIMFSFSQIPTYLHHVLHVAVEDSGLLASIPSVADFFLCLLFGMLSDFCTNRRLVSVKNARRISNSIAEITVAICMTAVSFTSSTALGMVCFVVSIGAHTAIHTGFMINYIDLAPNYTGTLMATGNFLMNIFMLIVPVLVSNIVTDVTNQYQWRIMFFLVAGLSFVCNAIFVTLLSSERQPWNDFGYEEAEAERKKFEKEKMCANI